VIRLPFSPRSFIVGASRSVSAIEEESTVEEPDAIFHWFTYEHAPSPATKSVTGPTAKAVLSVRWAGCTSNSQYSSRLQADIRNCGGKKEGHHENSDLRGNQNDLNHKLT
jgi:hypothetical protein